MDLEKIKEEVDKFTRDEKVLNHLSGIFKVLADPTRLRIIYTLSMGELCVTDISETLEMTQSSISHQLAILKSRDLIKVRKVGRKSYYSLDDDHVLSLFEGGYEHASHKPVSYTHLTLPTKLEWCRSRWSPYH